MFVDLYGLPEGLSPSNADDKHVIKEPFLADGEAFAWTQKLIFLAVCVGVIVIWFRVRSTAEKQTKDHPV